MLDIVYFGLGIVIGIFVGFEACAGFKAGYFENDG